MQRTWRGFRVPGRVLLAFLLLAAAAGTIRAQEQQQPPAAPPPAGPAQAPPATQAADVLPPIPIPEGQRTFKQFATIRVDDVVFAVGWQLARPAGSENAAYLPLVVGLQSFKHKMWSVKQKELQLTDVAGMVIEPMPLQDVRKNHAIYTKDYELLTRTSIINQLLPNAELVGGAPPFKLRSVKQVDSGQDFYGHTFFYPSPGETAVYASTLDYKMYSYDILYYADVLGKWLRLYIPEAKNRPALELVFKPEALGG